MWKYKMINIRNADERDLQAITDIYNDAVLNTLAIWNEKTVDINNRRDWLKTREEMGYPVLVAVDNNKVCGYASHGPFRPFEGYRFSAEISIYIEKSERGKGIGKKLLGALINHAESNNIHVLIAGIESGNKASIALHKAFGFTTTGHMPEVGIKKGQWLDLVMMQRILR